MRLFGKKANQQYGMADVPPELRPYYREQAVAARVRRTMARVLAILFVLAILAGGGAWAWMHRHSLKIGTKRPATTQHQAANQANDTPQQSDDKNKASTPPASNNDDSGTSGSSSSSGGNSSGATNPAPTQPAKPTKSNSGSTSSNSSGSSQSKNPTPIPNTGPGTVALIVGGGMAVVGVVAYRTYQKRTIRS